LLAAAAQAFIIFTVLLGKDGTLEKEPVLPAPQSVIIFAFAGVYGSVVNLFCLITVYVVIKVKGVKAQSLPTVCKAVVACQYLSKTAQAYSLVSFILYLGKFFDRVTDEIEDGDSGSMLMAILQIVCGIIVLPLLVYVFVAAHSLCNNELALFVSRAALMKSYATNIEVHQVISGVALLAFSTTFANDLDKVDNDSILGYMYLMSIFCAVACLNFSYAHYRVTHHLRGFERRQESLAQDKENCIAKMRLQALDKTPCMVAHAPDKPSIMGLRGVVVGNGVDNSGKVTVLVEGVEHKMEEYQLLPDLEDGALKEREEMADLKIAELDYRLEKDQWNLGKIMSIYIVGTQLFAGVQLSAIVAVMRWDEAAGIRLYERVATDGAAELAACADVTLDDPSGNCTTIQNYLCSMWSQCATNFTESKAPHACGSSCIVPIDTSSSGSDVLTNLIMGAIIGAAIGAFCGVQGTRCIVGSGSVARATLCCMGILGTYVVAVLGALGAHILFGFTASGPDRCNAIDLDPGTTDVIERLPLECITFTGAYFVDQEISTNGKACIIASTVSAAIFVLESSLLLSRKVQDTNPNAFAAFEATIFFAYTIFAMVVWTAMYIGYTDDYFESWDDWTNYTTQKGFEYASEYGSYFPIIFNQTANLETQRENAENIWMNRGVLIIVGGFITAVQVAGLYFTLCGRASVWMGGVKAILYVDSFIVPFFIFIIYLTLTAVNLVSNVLGFVLLLACVQYIFAIANAMQSDIWKLDDDSGPVTYIATILSRLAPLLMCGLFMLGLAMQQAKEDTAGLILMAVSGVVSLASFSIFLLFVFTEVLGGALDALQLLQEKFFPKAKEAEAEAEEEEEEEAPGGPGAFEEEEDGDGDADVEAPPATADVSL